MLMVKQNTQKRITIKRNTINSYDLFPTKEITEILYEFLLLFSIIIRVLNNLYESN